MQKFIPFMVLFACRPAEVADKDNSNTLDNTEEETQESEDNNGLTPLDDSATSNDTAKPDDDEYDDTGKPDDESGYQDCGPNFDPTDSCTGDWTTTICMYNSLIWWCENGVWMNEEDKPD